MNIFSKLVNDFAQSYKNSKDEIIKNSANHILLRASEICSINDINLAIKMGADINATDKLGNSALDLAYNSQSVRKTDAIRLLLSYGVTVGDKTIINKSSNEEGIISKITQNIKSAASNATNSVCRNKLKRN